MSPRPVDLVLRTNGVPNSDERDAVEPSDAGADVQLPGDELILVVAPLVELASGATLVQRRNKPLAMPFEERYGRFSFW